MAVHRERNATVLRARALRRNMTLSEGLLWRALRERPEGFKFRRQHPLGRFIVDFYCPTACLVIEVDGAAHSMGSNPDRDLQRDHWLTSQGLRVLRFAATDVMSDLGSVMMLILVACRR